MPHTKSGRLAWWQIWLIMSSGTILWMTGAAWVLLHYFGEVQGEFGTETNPAQPWLLRLHGLVMIPAILVIGSLLVVHIPKGWNDKKQRIAGIVLTAFFGFLVTSGYMLYYVGSDDIRNYTSIFHWVIGLTVPISFIWHYIHRYSNKKTKKVHNVNKNNTKIMLIGKSLDRDHLNS